ncbi:hypothetical protein HBN50_12300 [Halobacteriovorax sp. GB3]|uniref:hypothetical protein n=1 Tax=Halobacteriovorax sp. GB3 TaxID=2719615 RepID=UPI00235DCF8A|nr:hypothetical protein [Halobacteriovorax sp. GB3]MDD0853884.1 hypothetical protein [Halobacteriovorax sp. GB3]
MASRYKNWKELNNQILSNRFAFPKKRQSLGFYEILYVLTDSEGTPVALKTESESSPCYFSFSKNTVQSESLKNSLGLPLFDIPLANYQLSPFMIGDLLKAIQDNKEIQIIKHNPVLYKENDTKEYLCEDIIIAPLFDTLTKKLMITDPDEALALLAINPKDQSRLGLEIVFYSITNKSLPMNKEEREEILVEKISELAFFAPRIPIQRGSGSFFSVLLNLDNLMEEKAFIRNYKMFDEHSDVIFVTSDLTIRTGQLETIPFNGDHIDTVFLPIIDWHKENLSQKQIL